MRGFRPRTIWVASIAWIVIVAVNLSALNLAHFGDAIPLSTTRVNNLEITGTTDATGNVLTRAGVQLTSGTGPTIKTITSDPNGSVIEPRGSLRIRTDTGALYQNTNSGTTWAQLYPTYLATQALSASSGTYTPTTGTRRVVLQMCGGGGGGGGAAGGASFAAAGGGGSSGVYIEIIIVNPAGTTGGAYATGAAGTAGSAGANNGGNGGDSTIVIDGVTYTAKGGLGGFGRTSISTAIALGGGPSAGSTATSITTQTMGGEGHASSNVIAVSGWGGSSPFGAGAQSSGAGANVNGAVSGTGSAGTGHCSGGSGGAATTVSNAGGAGTTGLIVVDEYGN